MSALLQSAVVFKDYWYEIFPGRSRKKVVAATLTLTGQGSLANPIPASLFGLFNVREVRSAVDNNNATHVAGPDFAGANVVFGVGAPTDVAGVTMNLVVIGDELTNFAPAGSDPSP